LRYLMWLLKAAIFFVLFAFALNNQEAMRLNLFFGAYWQAPVVLVLLLALTLGIFVGVAVMIPVWLRARKLARTATAAAMGPAESPVAASATARPPASSAASAPLHGRDSDTQIPHGI
jgi:lipopolysaccharide assembly protein A